MNTMPRIDYAEYFRTAQDTEALREIAPGLYFARDMETLFDQGEQGIPLPWCKTFRVRRKEVTVVSGINGHGKSNWMGQVLLWLCKHGELACNLSMEMPPGRTLMRQCKQAIGNGSPAELYRNRFLYWTKDKYWLSDFSQPMTPAGVLGAVLWANRERGCTQIVIDSLMKCGIGEDDYNAQKKFMNQICELAKELDAHIWLVAHGRKKDNELSPMDKFDVKGTGTITDMADNVITVFRNKAKERAVHRGEQVLRGKPIDEVADAIARCDKQRHGDWEGVMGMSFHRESGQYIKHGESKPMDLLRSVLDHEPTAWEDFEQEGE